VRNVLCLTHFRYALLSRVDTQWPDFSRTASTFFIPFCHTKFQIPAFSSSHSVHFSAYSSHSFSSLSFPFLFYVLLFSFTLIYIFLPVFISPYLLFVFSNIHFFSSPSSLSFCSCRYFHSCLLFFYHSHLISSAATWLLTSFYLLFLFVRYSSVPFFPVYLSILVIFLSLFHSLFHFSHTFSFPFCRSLCMLSTFPVSTFFAFLPYFSPYHLSTSLP